MCQQGTELAFTSGTRHLPRGSPAPPLTRDATMKHVRTAIILTTLLLAGFAGGAQDAVLQGTTCALERVSHVLAGEPGGGETCRVGL